jgi:hypothetical protein
MTREGKLTDMSIIGVHLRVEHGISSTQLHDEWLRLFRASTEAEKVAARMWQEWKTATTSERTESPETRRLWAQYSAFQSDYRVLTAWRDLLHTAWVFATDGRECRLLTKPSKADADLVSIS